MMPMRSVLLSLLCALAFPQAVLAHPKLVSSSPTSNDTVSVVPTHLSATFNEKITPALSKLVLIGARADTIPLAAVVLADGDKNTLTAKITRALAPGRYVVKWQAAGADGHPVRGEFSFIVAPAKP